MTDTGVDLVAYVPGRKRAITIQVKTNLAPKRAGGKSGWALDWWVRKDSPAEMVALVDLKTEKVWFISQRTLSKIAQQKRTDKLHFYFYVNDTRHNLKKRESDYSQFLMPEIERDSFQLGNHRPLASRPSVLAVRRGPWLVESLIHRNAKTAEPR